MDTSSASVPQPPCTQATVRWDHQDRSGHSEKGERRRLRKNLFFQYVDPMAVFFVDTIARNLPTSREKERSGKSRISHIYRVFGVWTPHQNVFHPIPRRGLYARNINAIDRYQKPKIRSASETRSPDHRAAYRRSVSKTASVTSRTRCRTC
uniref:Uncharacterized protein n=1 Tax=Candidatus Kentrum sp. TUN TaxID=2126343 RepID=A0A451ACP0_9GAMM|nr:MAG: hypothetical protein BECKTUN1418D_GA0071000_12274 [Candidatus Kentron sp. TUN]